MVTVQINDLVWRSGFISIHVFSKIDETKSGIEGHKPQQESIVIL